MGSNNFHIHYKHEKSIDFKLFEKKLFYYDFNQEKICQFCGKSEISTSFKKESHIIPESLGNKYLLNKYECDDCNRLFSNYEDNFSKFLLPFRSLKGIQGKNGKPKHKDGINTVYHDYEDFLRIDNALIFKQIGKGERDLSLELETQKFAPIKAYKILLKMALSLSDTIKCKSISDYYQFLLNDYPEYYEKVKNSLKINVLYVPGKTNNKKPFFAIFKKVSSDELLPENMFILIMEGLTIQYFHPIDLTQTKYLNQTFDIPIFSPPPSVNMNGIKSSIIDFKETNKIKQTYSFNISLKSEIKKN